LFTAILSLSLLLFLALFWANGFARRKSLFDTRPFSETKKVKNNWENKTREKEGKVTSFAQKNRSNVEQFANHKVAENDNREIIIHRRVALCLFRRKYFFGRTCNRVLTIARGLRMARDIHQNTTMLGSQGDQDVAKLLLIGQKWIGFYPQILDPHPDILFAKEEKGKNPHPEIFSTMELDGKIFNYTCQRIVDDEVAYFYQVDIHKEISELRPREDLQEHALEILRDHYNLTIPTTDSKSSTNLDLFRQQRRPLPFVSVHRRWLEGGCYNLSNKTAVLSTATPKCTTLLLKKICDLSFSSMGLLVPELFRRFSGYRDGKLNSLNKIILFTDGQVPEKDATFPVQYNTNLSLSYITYIPEGINLGRIGTGSMIMLEISMMLLSEFHFGNPLSSVDLLVQEWRKTMHWWRANNHDQYSTHPDKFYTSAGMLPPACFSAA